MLTGSAPVRSREGVGMFLFPLETCLMLARSIGYVIIERKKEEGITEKKGHMIVLHFIVVYSQPLSTESTPFHGKLN